jgi:polysaccharide export outer membrane protein
LGRRQVRGGLVMPLLVAATLAGCAPGAFLSESGPTRGEVFDHAGRIVRRAEQPNRANYVLVDVDDAVVSRLSRAETRSSFDLRRRTPGRGEIGVGDILGLTIFESDGGGLFLPREPGGRPGNYVTLPNQQVGRDGDISVPYAGKIKAAGLLPDTLQTRIEGRLANRAVEPQVVVTIVDRRAGPVSVLGEVAKAENFSLDPGGMTILGAISRAGGAKFPAYESIVTLQRDGQTHRVLLADIARDPRQNIQLLPRDAIYLSHEPRYFVAMGAIGQSGSLGPVDRRLSFQDSQLTLMDALGRAGGLNDGLANARAVFVYRFEQRATLDWLEPRDTTAPFEVASTAQLPNLVPTIYLVDLIDPSGFFHASRFPIRGEDVIYVANAPASDLQKFLAIIVGTTGSTASIRGTVQ